MHVWPRATLVDAATLNLKGAKQARRAGGRTFAAPHPCPAACKRMARWCPGPFSAACTTSTLEPLERGWSYAVLRPSRNSGMIFYR